MGMRLPIHNMLLHVFVYAISVQALTINVPNDYPTIQQGVNAANNGDSLIVASGVYHEDVNTSGRNITISGSGNNFSSIIIGKFIIVSGESCTVANFTMVGDPEVMLSEAFEIMNASSPLLYNILITNYYKGIRCISSNPVVINCIFYDNGPMNWSELISCSNSIIEFTRNAVTGNKVGQFLFVLYDGSQIDLNNCLFIDNVEDSDMIISEMIHSVGTNIVTIDDCIFNGNSLNVFQVNANQFSMCNMTWNNDWDDNFSMELPFIQANPQICQSDTIHYVLNIASPCIPENRPDSLDCGIIGPLLQGCERPVPTLSDPFPAPDALPWPDVVGVVGATLACPTDIEAASLSLRLDVNGDGDYLDGGSEDWTPLAGYADVPVLQVRESVRFARSGSYRWEIKGRDVVSGWWVFSGAQGLQGIGDDWSVTINRLPRTWHLPSEVADLFAARDSLQDGDTLLLAPGTWAGGVDFGPWNVAVVGDGAPEEVVIQAPAGEGHVLHFAGSPVEGSCWIENLTLQGGNGGVLADSTALFARNCRLPEGPLASYMSMHGEVYVGGLLDARDCDTRGAYLGQRGLVLDACTRRDDVVVWPLGQGHMIDPSERQERTLPVIWISTCLFENNQEIASGTWSAYADCAALAVYGEGIIQNSVFADNRALASASEDAQADCAGLCVYGDVDVVGNLFAHNVTSAAEEFSGGVSFAPAACVNGDFRWNTVVGNAAYSSNQGSNTIVSIQGDVAGNLFAQNLGLGNFCLGSSCNLYWENANHQTGAPWTVGNCGENLGGEVWGDPLFYDPENRDYRLLPGSAAWPPNHQDEAPGCGLLGAFGLWQPVEVLGLSLQQNPLRARLQLRCEATGQWVHVYGAEDAAGPFTELNSLPATDSLLTVDIPLGSYLPARRFYRVTQDEPGTTSLGPWRWSLPAGSHPLPEPPLVTELDRLQKAGLPWKPALR